MVPGNCCLCYLLMNVANFQTKYKHKWEKNIKMLQSAHLVHLNCDLQFLENFQSFLHNASN